MKTPSTEKRYQARCVRFCDGDTVILDIDLGFGVSLRKPVRIMSLDSWELDSLDEARAQHAKMVLDSVFAGKPCTFIAATRGADCYGRPRGRVLMGTEDLAGYIVKNGLGWERRSNSQKTASPVPQGATIEGEADR